MQPIKNDGHDDYNLENAYIMLSEEGRSQTVYLLWLWQ